MFPVAHYTHAMAEPSVCELRAWRSIQEYRGRLASRALRGTGDAVKRGASRVGERASHSIQSRAVERGKAAVGKGAAAVGGGVRRAVDSLPDGAVDWGADALEAARRSAARAARIGLSPSRVVSKHRKRGHPVEKLADVRRLDLEQVDVVRGRSLDWSYPGLAALSGAGSSFVITGGGVAVVASGGVAAAPSAAALIGAVSVDATAVLGLASRAVGQIALVYGYDPEEPVEKIFVMSVVNAGTAMSASAKTAAMRDISRLTQSLVRGGAWATLEKSLVTKLSKVFAKSFGVRFTKQSLGKIVPAFGVVIGASLNWATLESVVDAANIAYRRRFLLEKYPQLATTDAGWGASELTDDDVDDTPIRLLDELADLGGPDLP